MILRRMKHLSLILAMACSACGMMDDSSTSTAFNGRHDWFEYAYYASPALMEDSDADGQKSKPLRLQ